jgi:hypothetical protein
VGKRKIFKFHTKTKAGWLRNQADWSQSVSWMKAKTCWKRAVKGRENCFRVIVDAAMSFSCFAEKLACLEQFTGELLFISLENSLKIR